MASWARDDVMGGEDKKGTVLKKSDGYDACCRSTYRSTKLNIIITCITISKYFKIRIAI